MFVGIFIIIGALIGMYTTHNKKFVEFSIGGAFGVIVALIALELIPEAYNHLGLNTNIKTIILLFAVSAIGFLTMFILDKFIPHHKHESEHKHKHKDDTCHNEHLGHVGVLATLALFLHNIIEGMTLYATAVASIDAGYLLCVGIGLHNIPMGIVIANTMKDKKKAILSAVILVLSSFVGGIIMSLVSPVSEFIIGILISLTVGMMVYLSIMELLNQITHSNNKRSSILGIILGLVLIIVSITLGGHHH